MGTCNDIVCDHMHSVSNSRYSHTHVRIQTLTYPCAMTNIWKHAQRDGQREREREREGERERERERGGGGRGRDRDREESE